jgi:hypothetical protein
VARAIYVGVVTNVGIVFNVGSIDRDTTSLFFRSAVDLCEVTNGATESLGTHLGQRSSQGGFTMVYVTDSANVDVRFVTFKFFFSHDN